MEPKIFCFEYLFFSSNQNQPPSPYIITRVMRSPHFDRFARLAQLTLILYPILDWLNRCRLVIFPGAVALLCVLSHKTISIRRMGQRRNNRKSAIVTSSSPTPTGPIAGGTAAVKMAVAAGRGRVTAEIISIAAGTAVSGGYPFFRRQGDGILMAIIALLALFQHPLFAAATISRLHLGSG